MNKHLITTQAQEWLSNCKEVSLPLQVFPIKLDASLRTYIRVGGKNNQSYVFCEIEKGENFENLLNIHDLYIKAGVAIPKLITYHAPYFLFEDLGNTHLRTYLNNKKHVSALHKKSILEQLLSIQRIPIDRCFCLPTYKEMVATREFVDLISVRKAGLSKPFIDEMIPAFCKTVLALPTVWVHRDFHWENLMITQEVVRVIDYHDAMRGPPSYDLASLIADRGFYQDFKKDAHDLVDMYLRAPQTQSYGVSAHHIWINVALRLFKIIGNFDRLARDIRPDYLKYQKIAIDTGLKINWPRVINDSLQGQKLIDVFTSMV